MITEILTRKRPLSSAQAHNTEVANKAASVSVVEEVVKIENKDKWTYEEGIIKYVLPLNDRVKWLLSLYITLMMSMILL